MRKLVSSLLSQPHGDIRRRWLSPDAGFAGLDLGLPNKPPEL